MRETKYMKALRDGKNYVPVRSTANKIKEFVVMGKGIMEQVDGSKVEKTFTTTAQAKSNREAEELALGWCKSHGLKLDRITCVG